MTRAVLILSSPAIREKAARWIVSAPADTRVEFKRPRRTLPQNDRMWAMLTDIAEQLVWHGQRLSPDDWKDVFMAALNRELRAVPGIDGRSFVNLGTRTSDLSKEEMSDLMALMEAFGASHGVTFHGDKR